MAPGDQQRLAGGVLRDLAICSTGGKFCTLGEACECFWSGRKSHPDDLRTCVLTGLPVHYEFATAESAPRLQPLPELLGAIRPTADERFLCDNVAGQVTAELKGGRCRVEAAVLSPLSSTLRRAPRPVASSASEFARLAQYTPSATEVDETIAASLRAYGPWRRTRAT